MHLAFAHLNLRRNPFGRPSRSEWAEMAIVEIDELLAHVSRPGAVVQFIGHQGRGKSTHMRAMHAHFPEAPYLYFGPDDRPPLPQAPLLFLDETQRLSWWRRERLFRRRATSIVLATHRDHARQIRRCGMAPVTVEIAGITPERLRRILDRRIELARRDAGPLPRLSEASIELLIARFGDNLRAIEAHLYEVFQTLEGIGDVEV